MVLDGAMAAVARRGLVLSHTAGVTSLCGSRGKEPLPRVKDWHQQLSKRLPAQRERVQVQHAGPMSCLQDQAAAEAPARLDRAACVFIV